TEPASGGMWRPALRRCLARVVAGACLLCARPCLAGEEIDFDIPAQAAGTALILLGQQSNEPVLYFYDDVQGKTSRAVNGTYTTDAAVDLMLTGTCHCDYMQGSVVTT